MIMEDAFIMDVKSASLMSFLSSESSKSRRCIERMRISCFEYFCTCPECLPADWLHGVVEVVVQELAPLHHHPGQPVVISYLQVEPGSKSSSQALKSAHCLYLRDSLEYDDHFICGLTLLWITNYYSPIIIRILQILSALCGFQNLTNCHVDFLQCIFKCYIYKYIYIYIYVEDYGSESRRALCLEKINFPFHSVF